MNLHPESEAEADVIKRLQHFQPRPSQRAYRQMAADAPWLQSNSERIDTMQTLSFTRPVRLAAAAILIVVIAGAIIWATPPLRSLAQEILDGLFNRSADDTLVIEREPYPTPAGTISPERAQVFDSVQAAEVATGLDIRQPGIDLSPYLLSQVAVHHVMQTQWLTYNAPGRYLSIYQRAAELGWLDEGLVGASAEIIPVTFENANGETITGEYVAGGWQSSAAPVTTDDGMVRESAAWSGMSAQRKLRWQDGDRVYEMVVFGGGGDTADQDLTQEDMIMIAASMQ